MANRFNPSGKKGGGYATIIYVDPTPYPDMNDYKNNGLPSNGYDSHNRTNMPHKKELPYLDRPAIKKFRQFVKKPNWFNYKHFIAAIEANNKELIPNRKKGNVRYDSVYNLLDKYKQSKNDDLINNKVSRYNFLKELYKLYSKTDPQKNYH